MTSTAPVPPALLRTHAQQAPPPAYVRCVVLDFDGTLTDADRHAPAFHARSRRALAQWMSWSEDEAARQWDLAQTWLGGLPEHAGWELDGRLVCPAHADPYLSANSIVRRILEQHRPELGDRALLDAVFQIHRTSYLDVLPPFRSDARSVIDSLLSRFASVWVVTNSHSDTVAGLLDGLGLSARGRLRVVGNASKFWVCDSDPPDARFDALPAAVAWPGVGRPVLLRRGRYFDVLRAIWAETGTQPAETLVAGDIFELDLAMPAALGAHVHLVLRSGTLASEREAVVALARGACALGAAPILERFS